MVQKSQNDQKLKSRGGSCLKWVISPSDVRASQKVGCYVLRRRDACGCIGCQCQNENRERRWPMFCMFWCWPGRSEGDTHCWRQWWWQCRLTHIPWQAMVSLINKRVGKTDSVVLTSSRCMWLPAHAHCDSCQCLCMSSSLSIFSFFYKCTTDLDQAPVTISWAQAPYPWAPCTLTTLGTVHAHILWCTKDKNNFVVTFFAITLYHFLHILH